MIDKGKLDEIIMDIKMIEEDEKALKLLIAIIKGRDGDINRTEIANDITARLNKFFTDFENYSRLFVYILIHEDDLIKSHNHAEAKYLTELKTALLAQAGILSPISKMSQEDKINSLRQNNNLIDLADNILALSHSVKINLN